MKIGHKLKALRIAKKIEPIEMAFKLGVSESTYRRFERDDSEPTVSILQKIAIVFGIKASYLLDEDICMILPRLRSSTELTILEYEKQIAMLKQTVVDLKIIQRRG